MEGLEKIISYIGSAYEAECAQIALDAEQECERINAEYSRVEQEEYWKAGDAGSRETERRMKRLKALCEAEAAKKIDETQQEMIDQAFALAAKKLRKIPRSQYALLLSGFKLGADTNPEEIVAKYRSVLAPGVKSVLFD